MKADEIVLTLETRPTKRRIDPEYGPFQSVNFQIEEITNHY